jgi:hypothetical protein
MRLDPATSMEWLKVYTGRADPGFVTPTATVVGGFLPPGVREARSLSLHQLPIDASSSPQRKRSCASACHR